MKPPADVQRHTPNGRCSPRKRPNSGTSQSTSFRVGRLYVAKGASVETATKAAEELTGHDAFAAHIDAELGIDAKALTNPRHAHIFPAMAFTVGSIQSCPSGGALGRGGDPHRHRRRAGHGRRIRHRPARGAAGI